MFNVVHALFGDALLWFLELVKNLTFILFLYFFYFEVKLRSNTLIQGWETIFVRGLHWVIFLCPAGHIWVKRGYTHAKNDQNIILFVTKGGPRYSRSFYLRFRSFAVQITAFLKNQSFNLSHLSLTLVFLLAVLVIRCPVFEERITKETCICNG